MSESTPLTSSAGARPEPPLALTVRRGHWVFRGIFRAWWGVGWLGMRGLAWLLVAVLSRCGPAHVRNAVRRIRDAGTRQVPPQYTPGDWPRIAQDPRHAGAKPIRGTGTGLGPRVPSTTFYAEYHSHRLGHLARLHRFLSAPISAAAPPSGAPSGATIPDATPSTGAGAADEPFCRRFIYLCGDSTLDNKHWLYPKTRASFGQTKEEQLAAATSHPSPDGDSFSAAPVNGYERALDGRMVKDVAFWMNHEAAARQAAGSLSERVCTINAAVEESTVARRARGLLTHDQFIRDHLTERDCLVISLGGNDVALHPTAPTILSMACLLLLPNWLMSRLPLCVFRLMPAFGYFTRLMGQHIEAIARRIAERRIPARVLVCMVYYLDESPGGSWADTTLAMLGYNSCPAKLQRVIRALFEALAWQGMTVGGRPVKPVPLFRVLDGKDTNDYSQRVEPSVQGGRKMARALLDALQLDELMAPRAGAGSGSGAGTV